MNRPTGTYPFLSINGIEVFYGQPYVTLPGVGVVWIKWTGD